MRPSESTSRPSTAPSRTDSPTATAEPFPYAKFKTREDLIHYLGMYHRLRNSITPSEHDWLLIRYIVRHYG